MTTLLLLGAWGVLAAGFREEQLCKSPVWPSAAAPAGCWERRDSGVGLHLGSE